MRLSGWYCNVAFSGLGHAFTHAFMLFYATVVLVLEREWQLGYDALFALAIPGTVAFAVMSLPAGWLAERVGAGRMMAVFFFSLGLAGVATGFAGDPLSLGVGLTLIGLACGIYHPVGIPWLIANAPNRGRALGINGVFGSIGTALAAVSAGGLAALFGWRAAFVAPGLLCIAVGVAFALATRRGWPVSDGRAAMSDPPAPAGDRRRAYTVLAVTILCNGMIYMLTSYALPKVFEARLVDLTGGSVAMVGALVTVCYLVATISQLVGGELADRYSMKRVYVWALFGQLPFYALAALLYHPALIPVAAVMISLNTGATPAETALVARYTPPEQRGRVFGLVFMVTLGVAALASAVIPTVHRLTGSLDGVLFLMVVLAVVAVVAATRLPAEAARPRPVLAPAE